MVLMFSPIYILFQGKRHEVYLNLIILKDEECYILKERTNIYNENILTFLIIDLLFRKIADTYEYILYGFIWNVKF